VASLSDSLWHRNRVLAEAALEHPFVQGIASGELARAAFAYYVGQDAAFLDAFCRAYALALAKSPDQDGLIAFRELLDAAAEELRLHRGYAERWNVDLHQAADPATAAYTNFLLAVAALEPVGHIAAAMTPCMRLYAPRPAAGRSDKARQSLSRVGDDLLQRAVRGPSPACRGPARPLRR
jgi:thiaminase/transcriptional activator TenA